MVNVSLFDYLLKDITPLSEIITGQHMGENP